VDVDQQGVRLACKSLQLWLQHCRCGELRWPKLPERGSAIAERY
jgi:hypothetical protein